MSDRSVLPAPRHLVTAAVALLLLGIGSALFRPSADDALSERQREVANGGSSVMPFDLDATTHRWRPTEDGLVQTVVADTPGDDTQVALIRSHLRLEADRFAVGDFSDPASIHGEEMPGLAALQEHDGRIEIVYADVAGGAELRFTTESPDLVEALHAWAATQLADHGSHAEMG